MIYGNQLVAQAVGVEAGLTLETIDCNPTTNMKEAELAVPLARLDAAVGGLATTIRLIFLDDDTGDLAPDRGYLEFEIAR